MMNEARYLSPPGVLGNVVRGVGWWEPDRRCILAAQGERRCDGMRWKKKPGQEN